MSNKDPGAIFDDEIRFRCTKGLKARVKAIAAAQEKHYQTLVREWVFDRAAKNAQPAPRSSKVQGKKSSAFSDEHS